MTARAIRAFINAYERKWSFLALAVLVFLGSVSALARLDLLPDAPSAAAQVAAVPAVTVTARPLVAAAPAAVASSAAQGEVPVKVVADSIGLSATIANPTTTNIESLDALLLKGAVRYPTSATLNADGNVVLFGHSSYLPVVRNLAYKTFNGIQNLKVGDTVTVYSNDRAYVYTVRSVQKENAETGVIPLSVSGKVLTLATCNSFATKSDRFVVTADFVESHVLGV